MGFFGRKKQILALDIGSHSIKYALLLNTGKDIKVVMAGQRPVPMQETNAGELDGPAIALKALVAELELVKKKLHQVIFALPSSLAIVRYVKLPPTPMDRVRAILRSEAEQHIPFSIDDVALDINIIKSDDKGVEAIICAIKQEKVDDYVHMITVAGLSPEVIDVSAFALFNIFRFAEGEKLQALAAPPEGGDGPAEEPTVALLDLGASTTDISVCSGNRLMLTRSVAISGNSLSEAVARRLNCSPVLAERYKRQQARARTEADAKPEEKKGVLPGPLGVPRGPVAAEGAPAAPKISLGGPKTPDSPAVPKAPTLPPGPGKPADGDGEKSAPVPEPPAPPPTVGLPKPPAAPAAPKPPAAPAAPAAPPTGGLPMPAAPAMPKPPAAPAAPAAPPTGGLPMPAAPAMPKPPAAPAAPAAPPTGGLPMPAAPAMPKPPAAPAAPAAPPTGGLPMPAAPAIPKSPAAPAAPAAPPTGGLPMPAAPAIPKPPAAPAAPAAPPTGGLPMPAAPAMPKPPAAPAAPAAPPTGGLPMPAAPAMPAPPAAPVAGEIPPAPPAGGFRLQSQKPVPPPPATPPGVNKMLVSKLAGDQSATGGAGLRIGRPKPQEGGQPAGGGLRIGTVKAKEETEPAPPPDGAPPEGGNSLGAAKAEAPAEAEIPAADGDDATKPLDDKREEIESAIKPMLDRLVGELKRSFDYYKSQISPEDIKKLYLCGGGAQLKDLALFLQQKTGLEVEVLNPLGNLSADGVDLGVELGAALGLGLRVSGYPCAVSINLLPADIAVRKRTMAKQRNITIMGVLGGALALELAFAGYWVYTMRSDELSAVQAKLDGLQAIVKQVEELKKTRQQLEKRRNLIRRLTLDRARWIDVLAELQRILEDPQLSGPAWCTALTFTSKSDCTFSGKTGDFKTVGELNGLLKKSPYFVIQGFPTPSTDAEGMVIFTFTLKVTQDPSAEEKRKALEAEESENAEAATDAAAAPAPAPPPAGGH